MYWQGDLRSRSRKAGSSQGAGHGLRATINPLYTSPERCPDRCQDLILSSPDPSFLHQHPNACIARVGLRFKRDHFPGRGLVESCASASGCLFRPYPRHPPLDHFPPSRNDSLILFGPLRNTPPFPSTSPAYHQTHHCAGR